MAETVQGLKELERTLQRLTEEVAYKATRKGAMAAAEVFRKEASRLAPVGEDEIQQSGKNKGKPRKHLFQSIIKRVVKDKPTMFDGFMSGSVHVKIAWSKKTFWGLFVEFGTSKVHARPFMRPAFDSKRQEALARFTDAVKEGIRKFQK